VKRCIPGPSLLAACLLLPAPAARADNWPHWRGPAQDGVSKETNIPTEWDETRNVAWKLPLPGMGGSTPVVWGDRIFLTSADGPDVVLLCVSTRGKVLWKRKLGTGDRPYRRDEGNNASPTPSTDGKHVWALAGTGDFACFDLDGKEVWRCNLQERYGPYRVLHGGIHTSPVLDGDRLYLALLHSGGHWVIALDKATGAEVWKVARPTDAAGECKDSYATPIVWHNGKDAYLVTQGNDYAVAHRLSDGGELWRVGDLNPRDRYNRTLRFVASPVATPDLIVVPSAKGGPVVGVKPDARGLIKAGGPQEQWRRPRGTPDVPSPLVHDGLVYLCGESGVLTCLDAKTGAELYAQRTHGARHRASPVYADGKVYLTARDGTVTVVKAGPKFEVLATNRLPDQTSASPAVAGGRLFLRSQTHLYCVGTKG
jgi:outer membrane protein assembly factor BamB